MSAEFPPPSSGMPGLDRMLQNLLPGDNVVWEVDSVEDYLPFVKPFVEDGRRQGRPLVYFRFARHRDLLSESDGVRICRLEPEAGFEKFLTGILDVIEEHGRGAYYVFDWLSDLAADWYSDRMLGNFFLITCPYLYQLDTITYFALRKNHHSFHATDGIYHTAQVVLEVYRKNDRLFLHPHKVFERHSPTLYTLHRWEGDEFRPVTSSAIITEILAGVPQPWLEFSIHRPGVWVRTFRQARETLHAIKSGKKTPEDAQAMFQRVLRMAITRDERFIRLAERYFDLADLIEILKRMVGTGLIGGKSLGMLLARAILRKSDTRWAGRIEAHDSFFIGSDVFYTYLVQNGCWWLRRRLKDLDRHLDQAEEASQKILRGAFPGYIQDQFREMLDYFGQSPLIVRSSSLLEDNYGNAFSGKYESVFCANQGSPEERLEAFLNAVRTVYSSTMSRESLLYRQHHGLLEQDEQMALLVQRVSGERYGDAFFPHIGGVGFSFNPFVWNEAIDPRAGFLRLVFGLGTRAVDRTDDDYTRLVSLSLPCQRIEGGAEEAREFSQRRIDALDLRANARVTLTCESLLEGLPAALRGQIASCDEEQYQRLEEAGHSTAGAWTVTFDGLLAQTAFAADLRELLETLQSAYDYPVDTEFTVNFLDERDYRINLLQCRPFQVRVVGEGGKVQWPAAVAPERLILDSRGPVIGHSRSMRIDRILYVVPSVYGQMSMSQRYSVARLVGKAVHHRDASAAPVQLLLGPGRWGTSMPSLGVPVSFAEINQVAVLGEIALMHEGLVPDVSLGTHFFNDLVEMDMLYLAVSPERPGHRFQERFLLEAPNRLVEILPRSEEWAHALRVIDAAALPGGAAIHLHVDAMKQRAICYWEAGS
ncbi:MAG TPA: PEP/pyruvate-binding domain-containing protein [Candidatus Paceibacterota bacterium]|nr:PEP/pyruvate-binding domain-containing protein [Verrucomicrobiota bacterium]HOX02230.1 PEP/pyruvate-binding domain-containing protein [Verrucomicrobiota bacterium]HRZ45029.1 PEP/pyruvate-binding domain-containing protein [Candidatus Paceibacterota bacterium]HRZ92978.1 PEP/pyruvate-binding domain-containing protein [Candidatus Paceibacterota bacterium]